MMRLCKPQLYERNALRLNTYASDSVHTLYSHVISVFQHGYREDFLSARLLQPHGFALGGQMNGSLTMCALVLCCCLS